jgi:lysozyme family protein
VVDWAKFTRWGDSGQKEPKDLVRTKPRFETDQSQDEVRWLVFIGLIRALVSGLPEG